MQRRVLSTRGRRLPIRRSDPDVPSFRLAGEKPPCHRHAKRIQRRFSLLRMLSSGVEIPQRTCTWSRRFCWPDSVAPTGSSWPNNVEYPSSRPLPRAPRQVAFTEELRPANPTDFEDLWKPIENRLGPAIGAVEAGTLFDEPSQLETMRECLALHLARSNTMERVGRVARDQAMASRSRS